MRSLIMFLMLVLIPASFTSCRHGKTGPQGEPGQNGVGQDGQDGQDGLDGIDGTDGLNGIGFDYVRGMDGAIVCEGALVIPANLVVSSRILALAPPADMHDDDGLTLTFGTADSPIRVYLGRVNAGEYCVLEKEGRHGWEPNGKRLIFHEDGYVAVVPPEFFMLLRPPVFADALVQDHVLEFAGECKRLNYSRRYLKIGRNIRINFQRD